MPTTATIAPKYRRERNGKVWRYAGPKRKRLDVEIWDTSKHDHCDRFTYCPLALNGVENMPKTIVIENRKGKTATEVEFTPETLAYLSNEGNLKDAMKGQFIVLTSEDYTLSRPSKNPGNLVYKRLVDHLKSENLIPAGYRVAQSTQVAKDEAAFRFVKADS